jgi:uncharacterized protein YndB with AHSA1/START domain
MTRKLVLASLLMMITRNVLLASLLMIAVPALGSPVTEQVRSEADGTTSLSHEVVVAAAPQAVWTAISTIEGWKTWAVPTGWLAAGQPVVFETSYDPAAKPGDPLNIKTQFLIRVPTRQLAFHTIKAPDGFPHFDALRQVNHLFELIPEGDATRVRLTGSGYANTEAGNAVLTFFKGGNKVSLEMLRERFETGPVNWAEKLKKPLK